MRPPARTGAAARHLRELFFDLVFVFAVTQGFVLPYVVVRILGLALQVRIDLRAR